MHLARPTALKTLDKYLTTNVSYPELISSPVHRSKWPLSALGAEPKTDWLHYSGAAFRTYQMGHFCRQKPPKLTQNNESSSLARQKCQLSLDVTQRIVAVRAV
jgi:hypothetical protein